MADIPDPVAPALQEVIFTLATDVRQRPKGRDGMIDGDLFPGGGLAGLGRICGKRAPREGVAERMEIHEIDVPVA
ncbi:MAG TPA: hypothetical protein VJ790_23875, partial [Dongiaceae bacterium]|nr:hypothetical protein [Dongiaceae bacterium]